MPAATILRLNEAVELGHALLQSIADENEIRILVLKGAPLHRYGLRTTRASSDVDLLVEPRRFAEFCDAAIASGWVERPAVLIGSLTTLHSRAFVRDGWPCDIDLHSYYPGFLADPGTVFESLWRRRVRMDFAHRQCDVPDRVSSILVLALHSLRGARIQPRHAQELDELVHARLTDHERADAAALALETGCAATLESVLPRLGIHVQAPAHELTSPELRVWRERVTAGSHGAYFWLSALRTAPLDAKARIAWRSVWPTRRDLIVARPDTVDTVVGRTRARVARWGRGIRSLPNALHAIVTHRG